MTADAAKTTAKAAAPMAAGVGIGATVVAILQGSPGVVQQIIAWGPAIVVIGLAVWFAERMAPPFLTAQMRIAESLAALSVSIQERFRQEDDVRAACRALSGQVERIGEKVDSLADAVRGRSMAAGAGGGQ